MIGMTQVNLRGYIVSLFSKSKKLLAVGCSYTDNCWTKPKPYMLPKGELNEGSKVGWEHGFSVWPEILAEKLGMECYNFGASGQGNSYILEKTYDQINKGKLLITFKNIIFKESYYIVQIFTI